MEIATDQMRSIESLFANREAGDEVEAVYSSVPPATALTREVIDNRVIKYMQRLSRAAAGGGAGTAPLAKRLPMEVTLDVSVATSAGGAAASDRVTIAGEAAIETALNAGVLSSGTVMRKTRRDFVALPDYRLRINRKNEATGPAALTSTIGTAPGKTFRLKRRLSYLLIDTATGDYNFRLDVTAVRQMAAGAAVPTLPQLMLMPERYELEIEFVGGGGSAGGGAISAQAAATSLLRHFNVLLKLVDASARVMRTSEQQAVIAEYVDLVRPHSAAGPVAANRVRPFIGPKPVTLGMANLYWPPPTTSTQSVRVGYTVTDKADGERRLLYVARDGTAYTINDRLEVRHTGIKSATARSCVLDGEQLEAGRYAGFDCYFIGGIDVRGVPLWVDGVDKDPDWMEGVDSTPAPATSSPKTRSGGGGSSRKKRGAAPTVASRLQAARQVVAALGDGKMIWLKRFLPIRHGDDLFRQSKRVLLSRTSGDIAYEIDGLIFTPMSFPVGGTAPADAGFTPPTVPTGGRWDATLKWKPPSRNTIDFTVRLHPPEELVAKGVDEVYRVADLMVGYKEGSSPEPITAMAFLSGDSSDVKGGGGGGWGGAYVERVFKVPGWEGDAALCGVGATSRRVPPPPPLHLCYLRANEGAVLRCENRDEIVDGSVVEFAYDFDTEDTAHSPYKWRPLKVRFDKMEAGGIAANNHVTAVSTWGSISHPVTDAIITGEQPLPAADAVPAAAVYYAAKIRPDEGNSIAMRRFHNIWAKNFVMLRFGKGATRSLFDFGVGRAGDLHRWIDMGVERVLGIDKFASNLVDPVDGAYARVMRRKAKGGAGRVPRVAFVPMDASVIIGTQQIDAMDNTSCDRTVAEALWGIKEHPRLAPYFRFASPEGFDTATCMFAVHYFFGTEEHLRNFATNVASVLRPGGHFIGVCLDGERVDRLLSEAAPGVGETVEGRAPGDGGGGATVWSITRKYDRDWSVSAPADNIGLEIDVFMETIGQSLSEYLVDYKLLVSVMRDVGVVPLSSAESVALGLGKDSTGFFDTLYAALQADTKAVKAQPELAKALAMTDDQKRYSFLNRWFVFRKQRA